MRRPETRATTPGERLRDFELAQQLAIFGLATGDVRRALAILADVDAELARRLRSMSLRGPTTRARAEAIRAQIDAVLQEERQRLRDLIDDRVRGLAPEEALAQATALERAFATGEVVVVANRVAASQVIAAVRAVPMDGVFLQTWVDRIIDADRDRVVAAIQRGIVAGDTTDAIVRAIIGSGGLRLTDGVREVSRRTVRAFVRAATIHTATVARTELFRANADIIRAETWVATLDTRTCVVCGALDGEEFPLDAGPRPPAHLACRCVTVPVLTQWSRLPESLRRAANADDFTGQVPLSVTFEEWLTERTPAFQDRVLGRTRGRLFRAGRLSLDRFVENGEELTLDQLRLRLPSTFAEAGL